MTSANLAAASEAEAITSAELAVEAAAAEAQTQQAIAEANARAHGREWKSVQTAACC